MDTPVLLLMTGITSLGAYAVGRRRLGLSSAALSKAFADTVDCAGTIVVFFLLNLGLGLAGVVALRTLALASPSLHELDDVSLLAVATVQGLVFHGWRSRSAVSRRRDA